jgi:L-arabinose isomerase
MTPVRFSKPLAQFMNEWFALGPTHHFATSVGHNAALFGKLAALLDWPFETVCL